MIAVDIRLARPGFTLEVGFRAPGAGVTALFGRSGAGKTSIIQAVAGVVRPDAGRIVVDGVISFDAEARIDVPIERRRCGYVFQEARLFPHLSVERNLRYGLKRARADAGIGFDEVVELLGIAPLLDRRPHTLSGGERQRVAIGRALLAQPRLLLMDEPLSGLDAARKADILPYLEALRDELKLPILYVSHSIEEVLRLADHVVALREGRVVAEGPVAEVMSRPDILPVIGRFDLGTVLDCTVEAQDTRYHLSTLAFSGGRLRVPQVPMPVGARVRARVRARDVALSRVRPQDVSVSNILPAAIAAIVPGEGPYADVALTVGASRLTASITRESVDRLGLAPGQHVWAMIKSVAVDRSAPEVQGPSD